MGFRVAVLFGFVLLLSAGTFCSATNETLEQLTAISHQAAAEQHQANRTDPSRPLHSPYTIRLRIHQLKNPAVKQNLKQSPENPLAVQPRHFSSSVPARSLELSLLSEKEPKVSGPLWRRRRRRPHVWCGPFRCWRALSGVCPCQLRACRCAVARTRSSWRSSRTS